MRSFALNVLLYCTVCYCLGCNASQKDGNSSSPYLSSEATLHAFLEACAAIDTIAISEHSHIVEYPLVNSWKIRRIDAPKAFISLSTVCDSIASFDSGLELKLKTYSDSLSMISSAYQEVLKNRDLFSKAQAEWEQAEDDRIKKRSRAISAIENIEKLKMAKEAANQKYLASSKRYNTQYAREYDRIKKIAETISARIVEQQNKKQELIRLYDIAEKSLQGLPSDTISLYLSYAIIDLQVPSKMGIMLSKKCRVELLTTNGAQPYSKWLVTKMDYFGE